jgi:tetratricopeptide (TPR) repeat protein
VTDAAEERARQILAALGGASAADLRAAATGLPEEAGDLLMQVAWAVEQADPALALATVLGEPDAASEADQRSARADVRQVADNLARLLGPRLARLHRGVAELEAGADALDAVRPDLTVPEDVPPDVAAVLQRALDAAGDAAPIKAVRAALAETRNIGLVIGDLFEGARRDPDKLATSLPALEARIRALQRAQSDAQAAAARLPDVAALAAALRAIAEARGELVAVAQLSLVEAGLAERTRGLGDPVAVARWDAVFEAAVRAELVPLARAAAQRLQVVAVDGEDFARVAVLAHRTGDLARAQSDAAAEAWARMEESLALARLPEHHDMARTIADDAVTLAAGTGSAQLHARARLSRGQVLEQLGDFPAARSAFRRVLEDARTDTSFGREVAFAALHLGRLELDHQPHSGVKTLDFARELARRGGEWLIYGPAVVALLEHLAAAEDRDRVGGLLRELAVEGPRLGGERGAAVLSDARAFLVERWGAAAVDALLAGP